MNQFLRFLVPQLIIVGVFAGACEMQSRHYKKSLAKSRRQVGAPV